jgi:hypothetical protein
MLTAPNRLTVVAGVSPANSQSYNGETFCHCRVENKRRNLQRVKIRVNFNRHSCLTAVGVSRTRCTTIGGDDLDVGDAFARVERLVTVSGSELR